MLTGTRVCGRHAILRAQGQTWVLKDQSSMNGTCLGATRTGQVEIHGTCAVRLGHPEKWRGAPLRAPAALGARGRPQARCRRDDDDIGIGHAAFRLADGELREYADTGDVSLEAPWPAGHRGRRRSPGAHPADPRAALGDPAQVRVPRDTGPDERTRRIEESLAGLGLAEDADTVAQAATS